MEKHSLINIFAIFFKLGLFSFGGGYAMVLMIQREVVDKHKWVTSEEFMDMLSVAQSAPGPFIINTSIMVGHRLRGLSGATFAAIGALLPAFVVMSIIATMFTQFSDNEIVQRIFKGVRPAAVALILAAVVVLAKKVQCWTYFVSIIVAISIYLGVSPLLIITGAIIFAIVYTYSNRKKIIK